LNSAKFCVKCGTSIPSANSEDNYNETASSVTTIGSDNSVSLIEPVIEVNVIEQKVKVKKFQK
jgi:hypothetical protein